MTDREMLELAAKAAGVPAYWSVDGTLQNRPMFVVQAGGGMGTMPYEAAWNPLRDDGLALRLAVRLRLLISLHERFEVHVVWWRNGERGEIRETDKDSYVATRRAIVRAAAEIGRQHD